MTTLYLLDPDPDDPAWAPFGGATAIGELRAGAWRLRERWERGLNATTAGSVPAAADLPASDAVVGPAWVVETHFAPKLPMRPVGNTKRLLHGGRTVAWRLDGGERWQGPFSQGDGLVIEGRALAGAFDLVTALEQLLFTDTIDGLDAPGDPIADGTIVLGNPDAVSLRGALLEPGVVLDASRGAIILESDVRVRSGTRLEGPLWVRQGTWIVGGQLRSVSAGPHCRLHGEISTSVFNGFANKSHDGFLGHSVVGEWVNFGAGTITSNLKNTYGAIHLDVGGERLDTQRTNLGSLIGDHAKIAIGTLLPAGCVIGAGANLFGAVRAPKYVAPFAWGEPATERVGVEQFITTAKRVLPRRDVIVDGAMEAALRALHARMTA